MPQDHLLYDPEKVYSKIDYSTSILARLTSFSRMMPDIFIGGVQKGGTSSLYYAMVQHPQIIPGKRKEIFYYNITPNYGKGLSYYKQFFGTSLYKTFKTISGGKPVHTIDATTHMLDCKEAPSRILNDVLNAKMIFILRDPSERAFSQYKMSVKKGFEKTSFENALKLEEERIKDGLTHVLADPKHNYAYQRLAYRSKGLYADHLKYWFNNFPKENIHVINAEEFYKAPSSVYKELCRFLDIDENISVKFEKKNEGKEGTMDPKTKAALQEFYKPHNEELYKLLNKRYDW
jgi:hypothetical protein